MNWMARWMRAAALLAGLTVLSCGVLEDEGLGDPGDGPSCTLDSECVPNGCCGNGTGVTHVSQAPSCGGQSCGGSSCPANQVACGCGVPLCRSGRCAVAWTDAPGCPLGGG